VYERPPPGSPRQKLAHPHLRTEMVAAVSGKRGRLYLKREQLLEVGQPALDFLTELVHRKPRTWARDVERLHELLVDYDKPALGKALQRAVDEGTIGVEYVAHYLSKEPRAKPAVVDVSATRGSR